MVNDSDFGLAGDAHTKDLNHALRGSCTLDVGYIGVNGFPPLPVTAPFGGYGLNGLGREGLLEFLRVKNIYVAL